MLLIALEWGEIQTAELKTILDTAGSVDCPKTLLLSTGTGIVQKDLFSIFFKEKMTKYSYFRCFLYYRHFRVIRT
jgi:hypothetical protein